MLTKIQEKIINEYEKQADNIVKKMLDILVRAQRKNDDSSYRKILDKLQ